MIQFVLRLMGAAPEKVLYIGGSDVLPPPLSREEEAKAISAMGSGNEQAKSTLIEHNLRLVVYIARRFESTGINLEDLISIGTIGLIKAINTFRPEKNIKLATYASRCIENEILMYLRKIASHRSDVSLDEPINTDWDGNELKLGDVLGTEPDAVSRPLEDDVDLGLLREALNSCRTRRKPLCGSATAWAADGKRPKRRWRIFWASPNPTFPGWKSALS